LPPEKFRPAFEREALNARRAAHGKPLPGDKKKHKLLPTTGKGGRPMKRLLQRGNRVLLTAAVIFLSGCFASPDVIGDVRDLPQDHFSYIDPATATQALVHPQQQALMDEYQDIMHFLPWEQEGPQTSAQEVEKLFAKFAADPGYGENARRRTREQIDKLRTNADLGGYPNRRLRGITVRNADVRLLPTHRPHYSSPRQGYPFDNLQESTIGPNTPIYIAHLTKDGTWAFAESSFAAGWVRIADIAYVDRSFMRRWQSGLYGVAVKDKIPAVTPQGQTLFKIPLGSIFPLDPSSQGGGIRILTAVANEDRRAVIRVVPVSGGTVVPKPLPLTPRHVAAISNELVNEPYGWGGLFANRDCSAMIRDIFAPFGIWLPRNSADQAREGGAFVDLERFSPEEKEAIILRHGRPYSTLLWRKGHIMLYIGSREGKPLVFHNIWGIRTRDLLGREGRKVIGHAAITTLHPGMELSEADPRGDLLSNLSGMTFLDAPWAPHP